jgi:diphthamide biosynthesis protein 3
MGAYYDEIEIEDMAWDEEKEVFHYPCPCGDRFEITRKQLANYEDIATCPSCSLIIRVVYDPVRGLQLIFSCFGGADSRWLIGLSLSCQLDFEDEPPDDDDGVATSEEERENDGDADSDEEGAFEDAMENLTISDQPRLVAATA